MKTAAPTPASGKKSLWSNVILLAALLILLFWKSFLPGYVHFANDGPLGQQMTAANQLPTTMAGAWMDQNSIGSNGGAYPPSLSAFIRLVLGPVGVAKFLTPIALFILGLGAWTFFRELRLAPLAATLGALAVTLNSGLFSAACWGVATQQIALGMVFFALALVLSITPETPPLNAWVRIAVAGLAIGMNVMEAADIGAIFSGFVALFLVYWVLVGTTETFRKWERILILCCVNLTFVVALILALLFKFGLFSVCLILFVGGLLNCWLNTNRTTQIGSLWGTNLVTAGLIYLMVLYNSGSIPILCLVLAVGIHNFVVFLWPSVVERWGRGVIYACIVAVFALFIAAHTLTSLLGSQVKGVAGMAQDPETKARRWSEATRWSFPVRETLNFFIPGLYGYRMDTPNDMEMFGDWYEGGAYWGRVGGDPAWDGYFSTALKTGEVVQVFFPEKQEFSRAQPIRSDGNISLQMVGDVKAAGLTRFELQQELTRLYSGQPGMRSVVENPGGGMRFSSGGIYVGVFVLLVALWAALQTFRGGASVFSDKERKLAWFWIVLAIVSLLLGYGRFTPLYAMVYQLPYVSTIRNPAKFLSVFNWSLLILFAFGIHGLSRRYLNVAASTVAGFGARLKGWWARAAMFDRAWTIGCFVALGLALAGWRFYSASRVQLEDYIAEVHLLENYRPDQAQGLAQIQAAASIAQTGWCVLFLALSVVAMLLVLWGVFAGQRARWGGLLIGLVLVGDLVRADLPYIVHWDYLQKYDIDPDNRTNSTNPTLNFLRDRPYEHRVAILPFRWPAQFSLFGDVYRIEWAQHQFQYYNIQSLDIVQMPRMPEDLLAFDGALQPDGSTNTMHLLTRRWQLTNTRYLLGPIGYVDLLNREFVPPSQRFEVAAAFDVVRRPGVSSAHTLEMLTTEPTTNGPYGVLEFTGALPRAKLYANWHPGTNNPAAAKQWIQSQEKRFRGNNAGEIADALMHQSADDQTTLFELASSSFQPESTVLLSLPLPPSVPAVSTNENPNAGSVEFTGYAPKDVRLKAKVATPAILLLNDKYDPSWQVVVDGKPAPLLRCNFIMRGVYLEPGEHTVEFRFKPPIGSLYVSCAAVLLGLLLLGYLAASLLSPKPAAPPTAPKAPEERKPTEDAGRSTKKRSD